MQIRVGYELNYDFPQPTPLILTLNIHYTPGLGPRPSRPPGGNALRSRCPPIATASATGAPDLLAPAGDLRLSAEGVLNDSGRPDVTGPVCARSTPSRTCPRRPWCSCSAAATARPTACPRRPGGSSVSRRRAGRRVQAICDFVHQHITFGYQHASPTKTAWETFNERKGVCRDFAHLAIALCRCMNIPARYCTGYLGDIGVPPPYGPMDFAGWFEAYLEGGWFTFDPRNNVPRIGRVLIARGRDAADVALTTTFGPNTLSGFRVWTDEVTGVLS